MAQPLGDRDTHGIAHAAVAVAVGDLLAVGTVTVPVIGEALESVALPRCEPSHAGAVGHAMRRGAVQCGSFAVHVETGVAQSHVAFRIGGGRSGLAVAGSI